MKLLFTSLTLSLALLACKPSPTQQHTESADTSASSLAVAEAPATLSEPESILAQWNHAINSDVSQLSGLYASELLYYGKNMGANACIQDKQAFLQKHTDFKQELKNTRVHLDSLGNALLNFDKYVTLKGKTSLYPSYLKLDKAAGWKIVVEGDEVTDSNKAKKQGNSAEISGDFDGDKKAETLSLLRPKINEEEFTCPNDSCFVTIRSSNPALSTLYQEMCIGGRMMNEGDLDGDGGDEISLLDDWFTSCWGTLSLYSYKKGKWQKLYRASVNRCSVWEDEYPQADLVQKKGNFILIQEHEMDVEGITFIKVKTRKIPVK